MLQGNGLVLTVLFSRRLPLQSYFYSFTDLRKEVQKFFNTGSVKNIEDMLYYLMLEGNGRGTGTEYGVNKCQDMVIIITCLINTGCTFNTPEQVFASHASEFKYKKRLVLRCVTTGPTFNQILVCFGILGDVLSCTVRISRLTLLIDQLCSEGNVGVFFSR